MTIPNNDRARWLAASVGREAAAELRPRNGDDVARSGGAKPFERVADSLDRAATTLLGPLAVNAVDLGLAYAEARSRGAASFGVLEIHRRLDTCADAGWDRVGRPQLRAVVAALREAGHDKYDVMGGHGVTYLFSEGVELDLLLALQEKLRLRCVASWGTETGGAVTLYPLDGDPWEIGEFSPMSLLIKWEAVAYRPRGVSKAVAATAPLRREDLAARAEALLVDIAGWTAKNCAPDAAANAGAAA